MSHYDKEHLDILKQGVEVWNKWRKQNQELYPNLRKADLKNADLKGVDLSNADLDLANLSETDLRGANLSNASLYGVHLYRAFLNNTNLNGAYLIDANLSSAYLGYAHLNGANLFSADLSNSDLFRADLRNANLSSADLTNASLIAADFSEANLSHAQLGRDNFDDAALKHADIYPIGNPKLLLGAFNSVANLSKANFSGVDLSEADLRGVIFNEANLNRANLSKANLSYAFLIGTVLTEANLTDCRVYGISVWDVQLEGAEQLNLIITPPSQQTITIDNLKVAQFIYLLLNNKEIRDVIDTITSKVVLILGRFTSERKPILDAVRDELRKQNYLPVLFDFEKPANRDVTETVTTLARLSRFIIADLTDPRSIPQELAFIVPFLPSVPVQPLLHNSQREYSMFEHFAGFPSVLPVYRYTDQASLLQSFKDKVIEPAELKAKELIKQ